MPRPQFTPEELAEYLERAEQSLTYPETPSLMRESTGDLRERFKEMFMSGDWLMRELTRHGASEQEATDICFAHGQRCVASKDFWKTAQESFHKWQQGQPDVPGAKLAQEIADQIIGGKQPSGYDLRDRRKDLFERFTKFFPN